MSRRSWTWRIAAVAGGMALAVGLAACGDDDDNGDSGDTTGGDGQVTLRLGYVTPAAHPYGIAVDAFVAEVAEESGGAIEITTLPSYQGGDVPLLADVKGGAVEMATVSTATFDSQGVRSFDALQAPFLITRYDLEREVISGDIGRAMLDSMEEGLDGDVVGLAIHEGGLRKPLATAEKGPLDSLAAFDGAKLRSVESAVLRTGLEALGADPTPIPIPDVYGALQNGTVDGMEANLGLIQTFKFFEVSKFVSNINFWPFPTALVMNKDAYDQLSDDQQQAIRDAADNVPNISIDIFTGPSELPQTLCDEGITFVNLSEENTAALEEAGQTAIAELTEANEETGEFVDQIQEIKDGLGPAPAGPELPAQCTPGPES